MAGNQPPHEGLGDDFFEQMMAVQPGYGSAGGGGGGGEMVGSTLPMIMGLQLGSSPHHHINTAVTGLRNNNNTTTSHSNNMGMLPLGLNLEDHSFLRQQEVGSGGGGLDGNNNNGNSVSSSTTASGINERDSLHMTSLFPALGHLQMQAIRPSPPPPQPPQPQLHQQFQAQPAPVSGASHPPAIRPRVRARRGQATDPHSIAERLRRERIAERMKALQELVPTANKTDRAAMLDEIVDYVKFLRLQVKVLSMSRLGAAGAVAQLVADIPMSSVEGEATNEGTSNQQPWEKWSNDGTEQQVAKLMEEDIGSAMQFLQSKALCIMPISLASAIFRTHQPDGQAHVKPESNVPS